MDQKEITFRFHRLSISSNVSPVWKNLQEAEFYHFPVKIIVWAS